jgi:hypothetical protein
MPNIIFALFLMADLPKKIVIDELLATKIKLLESQQTSNDNEQAAIILQDRILQSRMTELKKDNEKKNKEEKELTDDLFKKNGLDKKEWKLDLEKMEFVKNDSPKPSVSNK